MKLSGAIRLGAMLTKQAFHTSGKDGETACVMKAAGDAIGINREPLAKHFPILDLVVGKCSECGYCYQSLGVPFKLSDRIVHLNDHHRWTREAIADLVETVEPADPPAPVPVAGEREGAEVGSEVS